MTTLCNHMVYFESWKPNNNKYFWWSLRFVWIKLRPSSLQGNNNWDSYNPTVLPHGPRCGTSCNGTWFVLKSLVCAYKGLFRLLPRSSFTSGMSKLGRGMWEISPSVCVSFCAQGWCSAWPGFTMAQTSLCTLLSATALCPSQLLAMQCHSSLLDICWPYPATSDCTWDKPWRAGRSRLGGRLQPSLACSASGQGSLGAWHRALTIPCCSHTWVWPFLWVFHCNLSINHPFLQMQASFPLCSRYRAQTRGELPWGRGRRYDHAGWPCSWSHEVPNTQHIIISEEKKRSFHCHW